MNPIKKTIKEGNPVCGTWISMGSTQSIELMGKAGYDFLILDTQHGAITWDQLLPALQVLGNTPALIRVPWRDPAQIMRAADLGAAGVIVPMVSTAEEARQAVDAIRYPPHGSRSFGPVRSYYSATNDQAEPLCLVMIETAEAMRNLDAIAATPGLDGLFIGPVDLALSMGLGAALVMPPQVFEAVDRVVEVCNRHGLIAGSAALGLPNTEELLRRGLTFIAGGSDFGLLRKSTAADVEQTRAVKAKFVKS